MNDKRNYWKGYLICMPLLLCAIAATGNLDTFTAITVTVSSLLMALGSFISSHRKHNKQVETTIIENKREYKVNNNKNNWKWYLISIPLFLGLIGLTGELDEATVVLVGGGFLLMAIGSFILSRRRLRYSE